MAIDDNEDYTLTGAQVKDLVARIKAGGGGGMTVYVDASFATPSSITGVFSDSALTTPADPDAMAGIISAGSTVVVIYDGGQAQEYIELSSVNSNSRFPEVGHTFTSTISTNAVFSAPTVVTLLYDGNSGTWSVETAALPTKTSDLTNDGSDGTSTYVEADDLATVATSGSYNDLSNKPTIPAAQVNSDWNSTSGVSQILNRPTVRHVSSVSDAGWSGAENHLIDGSALAYWNGAYSGTASNLKYFANSSVTTANLQNDCVTASKLYDRNTANTTDTWLLVLNGDKIQHRVVKTFNSDGSIPKSAMHGIPAPDPSSVITNWGSISASGNNEKTISADGFVVGKGCTFAGDQSAIVKLNGQEVGGVSYTTFSGYMQVAYCIPVKSGDKVQFYLNKSGPQHQGCKLIGWKM